MAETQRDTFQQAVLRERAAVEEAITGLTVCEQMRRTVAERGDEPAMSWKDPAAGGSGDGWATLTWQQVRGRVLEAAAGLAALGLRPGEAVALMAGNRPEHTVADLGALHAGGVPSTFYATLASEQVAYVARDAGSVIAILEGTDELARWRPVLEELPEVRHVIVLDETAVPEGDRYLGWQELLALGRERLAADPDGVEGRWRELSPDDPVTVLYTSGTTGRPKGVVLTHRNVLYEVQAMVHVGSLPDELVTVSYLPIAHIAERVLSIYGPARLGGHVHYLADATQLADTLREVRPTLFFGVPRVWEKLRAGLTAALAAEQDDSKRAAVEQALEVGRAYVQACEYGREPDTELAERFRQTDEAVLTPLRALIGLDRLEVASSGAAPLPVDVARFLAGLGLKVMDVYGMTETTGQATGNRPEVFRLGTVGRPLPGVEMAVAGDGEILLRGPLNTPGYRNLPSTTEDLIDSDGWVHTGDIGELDEDGFLSVVDRKKELIINASGKNISPAAIENLLKEHPLIGQALAYGDGRRYVVALLTLDGEVAPGWAAARGIETVGSAGPAQLARHPDVVAEVGNAVEAANSRLARTEQVKNFHILPVEWTAESEELTPTFKLRRRIVHDKYADVLEGLYSE